MKHTIIDTAKVYLAYISGVSAYFVMEGGLKLLALLVPTLYTIWKWRNDYKQQKPNENEED